jgi:adenylate kinase
MISSIIYLILLGAPGSGKGTQAEFICDKYKISHLSTGDILRKNKDTLPQNVQNDMNQGKLLSDEVIYPIVKKELKNYKNEGWLFDGFPRTLSQALELDKMLQELHYNEKPLVIYLEVSNDEIIKRLSNRRVCPNCGTSYNLESNKPKEKGYCDKCHSKLIQRKDDTPSVIKERLKEYDKKTQPLIKYYKKQNLLITIPTEGKSIKEISKTIIEQIGKWYNKT